jgi:hypothetical protein
MMQPCASAAKLLGGGPILRNGFEGQGEYGSPPPRIVLSSRRHPDRLQRFLSSVLGVHGLFALTNPAFHRQLNLFEF